jgi:hypothetical protein
MIYRFAITERGKELEEEEDDEEEVRTEKD